jgi:nicotinate-nucleotide--dimethylbenzimidazole phosphoribosyltransferase
VNPSTLRRAIAATDPAVAAAARSRIDQLTKPRGSLGRIEALAVQLCAIAGGVPEHNYERRAILVAAGDHGVADDGVSAYPPEVTAQMVGGFLAGTAAIGAFARAVRAEVYVANFGVREVLAPHGRLLDVNVGRGTANLARQPAITRSELGRVIAAGYAAFDMLRARVAFDVIALGEMGIGNTTSASAIVAAFTGNPARAVVGRGTGIDDAGLERKVAAIDAALARCRDFTWEEIASEAGGFEIVGLAGVMLAAASARIPIVLDGFIVAAAALVASEIDPNVLGYCIAAHRSQEPGHAIALAALRLQPLLDLDLRLGEGSGAALVLPIVEAAVRMVREMRTFAEAGVATERAASGTIEI